MGFYNSIVMTLKLKEGVIMKNRLALASVICLLLVLTLSVSAYTPWGIEVVNDGLPTVVGELRMAYELASATQAASPDFLSDLESLITRLEALVFAPNTSTFGFETLMSTPVEVSYFNRFVGSDDQIGQILYFQLLEILMAYLGQRHLHKGYQYPCSCCACWTRTARSCYCSSTCFTGQESYQAQPATG